jgi:hypothetical protein
MNREVNLLELGISKPSTVKNYFNNQKSEKPIDEEIIQT